MDNNSFLNDDELLDVVNDNDQVVGQKYRSEVYAHQMSCFRVINAFLINKQKYIWIPRRSPDKKLFPLCLDASVGGHVMSGESYQQAFERELQEELNMEISQLSHSLLAKLTPHQHNVSAYMHVYVIMTDKDPVYNQSDFVSAAWLSMAELQLLIKKGEPVKGDLPVLVNLLQELV